MDMQMSVVLRMHTNCCSSMMAGLVKEQVSSIKLRNGSDAGVLGQPPAFHPAQNSTTSSCTVGSTPGGYGNAGRAKHSVGMGLAEPGVGQALSSSWVSEHAAKTWHPPVPTAGTRRGSKSS